MAWEEAKDVRIVTKNFGVRDSHRLSVYTQRGGFQLCSTHTVGRVVNAAGTRARTGRRAPLPAIRP